MTVFYNEIDPFAADWLERLIEAGHIASGIVDRRSIEDIEPGDLEGFAQCHFFAGIGGWSHALRLADWPDDRPVWTGSCPCQPFSVAGKGKGTDDERHLWPSFCRLIAECSPPVCFGEQVASSAGRQWLAGIQTDLEGMGYAFGAADLCAASVGAPHIRQRLYWVADSISDGVWRGCGERVHETTEAASQASKWERGWGHAGARSSDDDWVGNATGFGRRGGDGATGSDRAKTGNGRGMGHADLPRRGEQCGTEPVESQQSAAQLRSQDGHWSNIRVIECHEPTTGGEIEVKYRRAPAEPALFPLASGLPGRVGILRGAGNAIVPQVAAEFVGAFMDIRCELGATE